MVQLLVACTALHYIRYNIFSCTFLHFLFFVYVQFVALNSTLLHFCSILLHFCSIFLHFCCTLNSVTLCSPPPHDDTFHCNEMQKQTTQKVASCILHQDLYKVGLGVQQLCILWIWMHGAEIREKRTAIISFNSLRCVALQLDDAFKCNVKSQRKMKYELHGN